MKDFSALVIAKAPPAPLFATIRDRLIELVGALDDIESIEEVDRAPEGGALRVVNRWHARQTIPLLLRGKLGHDGIQWLDTARWYEDRLVCTWDIVPSIGDGAITCVGETHFLPAMGGRGTRLQFDGKLDIDPAFIGGLVGPFQGPVRKLVESIVTTLIPTNFRAVAEAAAKVAA
ncbi:MAG: hypothetical protein ABW203_04690 [Novosphingobium sp.]